MSIELLPDPPVYNSERIEAIVAERVRESIDDVRAQLRREDVGWTLESGSPGEDGGFSLQDIKDWSSKLRTSRIAAPWLKRGYSLRSGFVWDGGISYSGLPEPSRGKKNVDALTKDAQNRREFFGAAAHKKREGRLYHDGFALWIGKNSSKKLESIPLEQIADDLRHPEFPGVIIGYLREWEVYDFRTAQKEKKRAYYIVNGHASLLDGITEIKPNQAADAVTIDKTYTAFHEHANKIDGFAYGIPDALAAWIWNNLGRDSYMDGSVMTKALASIAFRATSKSKTGTQNASMKFARPMSAGSTAVMGAASDLSALGTAGKGYDYKSLRPMIATIATALDLTVSQLTSDPSESSFASENALDLPGRITTQARRDEHAELDVEVLVWMGAADAKARFNNLEDPVAMYRRLQAESYPWLQGVEKPDKFQERAAIALGLLPGELGGIPDGVLVPNNQASWERADIDPKDGPAGSTSSPSQGRSTGTGGSDNSNDIRSDGIGS